LTCRAVSSLRAGWELFLLSLLLLFLELACIRWFPAHVVFLTFFTNTVLLACFLGMSVGCLAASRPSNFMVWTPLLLAVALAAGLGIEYLNTHDIPRWLRPVLGTLSDGSSLPQRLQVNVASQASSQHVYFGTEWTNKDLALFVVPIELLEAFFFLLIALIFIGPGQELGRALDRMPGRLQAYTCNILGSLLGVALFAACAWLELSPLWWFAFVAIGFGYLLATAPSFGWGTNRWAHVANACVVLVVAWLLASWTSGFRKVKGEAAEGHFWSPYYRVDYDRDKLAISVNQIGHQQMISRSDAWDWGYAYALPYLLQRDTSGRPFENVLIIGAGSGNDISRALQWGAKHVDAVEIDPIIQHLGNRDHPDQPYQDPRVAVHLDDGRHFLRSTDAKYDLVIYALVDSLVLHSSFSNLRLESYLFTRQALADVQHCLKPDGVFVMYNFFRQGWLVARLKQELLDVFGDSVLVLTFPYCDSLQANSLSTGYTMFLAQNTPRLKEKFREQPAYWIARHPAPTPGSPNGFSIKPSKQSLNDWERFGLTEVEVPAGLPTTQDDWPFLYLRSPLIPGLTLHGMAIMAAISLLLIFGFLPKGTGKGFSGRMFFLGAGFMLIETKAVVQMALLFGSTWLVNAIVLVAVLLMILLANLFVFVFRPVRLWPYFVLLGLALLLNIVVPLDSFLGWESATRIAGSCLLVFAPIWFAGIIFAACFAASRLPDRDFGANIAGAIFGGLSENASMLLGFCYLMLVALAFYGLSAILGTRNTREPAAQAE
jgi:spermidine synthase